MRTKNKKIRRVLSILHGVNEELKMRERLLSREADPVKANEIMDALEKDARAVREALISLQRELNVEIILHTLQVALCRDETCKQGGPCRCKAG